MKTTAVAPLMTAEDPEKAMKWAEVTALVRQAALLPAEHWPDERIKTIAKAVAPPGATLPDLAMFLATSNRYGLDPLIGEIWLAQIRGKLRTLVGRDGMLKTALRDPAFEGVVSGVVREGDEFEVRRQGKDVSVLHVMGQERGEMLQAYAVAYHRHRMPVVFVRDVTYYKHLSGDDRRESWKLYPEDMLETRCIAGALRRMFTLAGIYTEAEWVLQDDDTPHDLLGSQNSARKTRDKAARLARNLHVGPQKPEPEPEPEPEMPVAIADVVADVVANVETELLGEVDEHDERPGAEDLRLAQIRKLFWVVWKSYPPVAEPESDVARKEWQAMVTGKHSQKDWTVEDYQTAVAALQEARAAAVAHDAEEALP